MSGAELVAQARRSVVQVQPEALTFAALAVGQLDLDLAVCVGVWPPSLDEGEGCVLEALAIDFMRRLFSVTR